MPYKNKEISQKSVGEIEAELSNEPYFTDTEYYKKLCERAGIEYDPSMRVDFAEKIIDGKLYIGPEIADYYEKRLSLFHTWASKIAFAAKENGFRSCSIKEYQDVTDMECPENLNNIFVKEEKIDSDLLKYIFLFGCESSAYYYCRIKKLDDKGNVEAEDDNMFIGEDVFRRLGMMHGPYQYSHKYDY